MGIRTTQEKDLVLLFNGGFMSNFEGGRVKVGGEVFLTNEHYYAYTKARFFNDFDAMRKIEAAETPKVAKFLSSKVQGFEQSTWDTVKYGIMLRGLNSKFEHGSDNYNLLKATKCKLLGEARPDMEWGIGLKIDDPNAFDFKNWKGKNLLGLALMSIRDGYDYVKFQKGS